MFPLPDEVSVMKGETVVETIPAYVGYQLGGESPGAGAQTFNREEAVCIVMPGTKYQEELHAIVHDGRRWRPNGAPAVHYAHGEAHHVTIPLQITEYMP